MKHGRYLQLNFFSEFDKKKQKPEIQYTTQANASLEDPTYPDSDLAVMPDPTVPKVKTKGTDGSTSQGEVMQETEEQFRNRDNKSWMVDDCTPVRFGSSPSGNYGYYYIALSSGWTREESIAYNDCIKEKKDFKDAEQAMDEKNVSIEDIESSESPGPLIGSSNHTARGAASSKKQRNIQQQEDNSNGNIPKTPHPDMVMPKLGPSGREAEIQSIVSNPGCPENNYGMSGKDCLGNCKEYSNLAPYLPIGDYAKPDCLGVCNGDAVIDCMGVCGGGASKDMYGTCCYDYERDCSGDCFGRKIEVDGRCCKKIRGCRICGPEGASSDYLGEVFDAYEKSIKVNSWNSGNIKPKNMPMLSMDCSSSNDHDPIPLLPCEDGDTDEHCKQEWPKGGYTLKGDCDPIERVMSPNPEKGEQYICPGPCALKYEVPSIKIMQQLGYAVDITIPYHPHISGTYILTGDPEEPASEYSFLGYDLDGIKHNVNGAKLRLEAFPNPDFTPPAPHYVVNYYPDRFRYRWRIYGRYKYDEDEKIYEPITDWTVMHQHYKSGQSDFSILSEWFSLNNCDNVNQGRFPHAAPWIFHGSEVSEVSQVDYDYTPIEDKICATPEQRNSVNGYLIKWQGEIHDNQEAWVITYSDNRGEGVEIYNDEFDNQLCSAWIPIISNPLPGFQLGRIISGSFSTQNLNTNGTYNNCDFKCGDQMSPISVTKNLTFELSFTNVETNNTVETGEMIRPIDLPYTKRQYEYIEILLNNAVDDQQNTNYYFEKELSNIVINNNNFVFKNTSGVDEFYPDDVTFIQKLDTATGLYKTFAQIFTNPIYKGEFVDVYPGIPNPTPTPT